MNAARIRGFLLKHPKPTTVRVTTVDGDAQQLSMQRGFARCADTIVAVGADLIECLDKDGNLIRALRVSTSDAQRSEAAEIPAGIAADPDALMLSHFANLLHRAYEHSTEIAFNRMVDLVERIGDRSEAIEARLERQEAANRRLVQDQIDDAFDRAAEVAEKAAEGEGELGQQLVGAFLSGKLAGPAKPAVNGKSNGAGNGAGKA